MSIRGTSPKETQNHVQTWKLVKKREGMIINHDIIVIIPLVNLTI